MAARSTPVADRISRHAGRADPAPSCRGWPRPSAGWPAPCWPATRWRRWSTVAALARAVADQRADGAAAGRQARLRRLGRRSRPPAGRDRGPAVAAARPGARGRARPPAASSRCSAGSPAASVSASSGSTSGGSRRPRCWPIPTGRSGSPADGSAACSPTTWRAPAADAARRGRRCPRRPLRRGPPRCSTSTATRCVVVFDYRRYQDDTVAFGRAAAARGATVVLFTDEYVSPLADDADVVLTTSVDAPTPFDVLTPAMAVVEALVGRRGRPARHRPARPAGPLRRGEPSAQPTTGVPRDRHRVRPAGGDAAGRPPLPRRGDRRPRPAGARGDDVRGRPAAARRHRLRHPASGWRSAGTARPVLDLPAARPGRRLRRPAGRAGHGEASRPAAARRRRSARCWSTPASRATRSLGPAEMAAHAGAEAHEIVRLESVAEQLAADGVDAVGVRAGLRRGARAYGPASAAPSGVKSVAAYRTGFDLDPSPPSPVEVEMAAADWLADEPRSARRPGARTAAAVVRGRARAADPAPRRLRRPRHPDAPQRPDAAHRLAAPGARPGAGDAAALLPVHAPGQLPGARLPAGAPRRRADDALRRAGWCRRRILCRVAGADAVRQGVVLVRRVRPGRALLPRHAGLPPCSRPLLDDRVDSASGRVPTRCGWRR